MPLQQDSLQEKKETMKRTEILNLLSLWPNDIGVLHTSGSEEKNKFKDAFWFIAPVWFLNNRPILSCCIHLKIFWLLQRWITVAASLTEVHINIFFFFLQENNYKTLNHFYITLWKQKPLIWVTIWTAFTTTRENAGCFTASLPPCSKSDLPATCHGSGGINRSQPFTLRFLCL